MSGREVFSGGLSFISLADILQVLGTNSSTGILHMTSQYVPTPGRIFFSNGNPVNADSGFLKGLDAIYALFGWTEGKFQFCEKKVQVERVVNHSRMEIVLDALRMLDDGEIKRAGPPSCDQVSVVQSGGPEYDKRGRLPIVKGPFVDYTHVIKEERFRDGEKIVKEGAYGNWIWVVLEGMVKIVRQTSNGPMTIAHLGDGSFIGTFTSFLFRENVRNATVIAVGDVHLGLLDTLPLCGEYSSLSSDFKGILLSLAGRLGKITDRAVDFFTKKDKTDELTRDKEAVEEKKFSKEEVFIITKGETYVVGQTPKGRFPLLTLEKEDVFGCVPFMDIGHESHSASVLASKDLKVNKLDTQSLQNEYDELSRTFRNLIDNMGTCVSATTEIACHLQ